jgi:phosphatidylserine synthase
MLYYFDFFIVLSVLFPKSSPNLVWEVNAILLLSIIIVFYFLMLHKGKYKEILKRNYAKDKSSFIAILFPLFAFILFNVGFVLKILQNQGKI